MVFLEEILPLPLLLINPYRVQTYLVIIVMIVIVGLFFFFFLICILTKGYQSQLGLDLSC